MDENKIAMGMDGVGHSNHCYGQTKLKPLTVVTTRVIKHTSHHANT